MQLFSAAVVDQILLSGANFFVGYLLIRKTSDVDYGTYVLVQSAVLLLITVQSAVLTSPLAILAPKRTPELSRQMIGSLELVQRRLLLRATILALCVSAALYGLNILDAFRFAVIAVGILACSSALRREYVRRVLFIYSRTNTLLRIDSTYALIFVGGTSLAILAGNHVVVWTVIALGAAGWAGAKMGYEAVARAPGWAEGSAAEFWYDMRRLGIWAAVGSLAYWLYSQGYNYVLASRLNLTAVADVNASRLLIMPIVVFTVGMESLLVPKAAGWLAKAGLKSLLKYLTMLFLAMAAMEGGYCLLIWTFRDWLTHEFLRKAIGNRDLLLGLWLLLAMSGLLRMVIQSALVALEPLKLMAGLTTMGALVSLSLMWFGVNWWGTAGVLISQMTGDIVVVGGYFILLHREWNRAKTARDPALNRT